MRALLRFGQPPTMDGPREKRDVRCVHTHSSTVDGHSRLVGAYSSILMEARTAPGMRPIRIRRTLGSMRRRQQCGLDHR